MGVGLEKNAAGANFFRRDARRFIGVPIGANFAARFCADGVARERLALLSIFYGDRCDAESLVESTPIEHLGNAVVEIMERARSCSLGLETHRDPVYLRMCCHDNLG